MDAAYHSGHVPEMLMSQGSMHGGWNLWSQGRTRTSSPTVKSSVQMEQPRWSSGESRRPWFSPLFVAVASWEGISSASVSGRETAPDIGAPLLWRGCGVRGSSGMADSLVPIAESGGVADGCDSSSRAGSGFAGAGSPNLTIGSVSSTALANPLARLCDGRPP